MAVAWESVSDDPQFQDFCLNPQPFMITNLPVRRATIAHLVLLRRVVPTVADVTTIVAAFDHQARTQGTPRKNIHSQVKRRLDQARDLRLDHRDRPYVPGTVDAYLRTSICARHPKTHNDPPQACLHLPSTCHQHMLATRSL